MKLLGLALTLSIAAQADFSNQCRNVWVDDSLNPWEEGFGRWEIGTDEDSRDVEASYDENGRLKEVRFGQTSYDVRTDRIEVKESEKELRYTVFDGNQIVQLKLFPKSKRGVLLIKPKSNRPFKKLAEVDCSFTDAVEKASVGDKNVRPVAKVSKKVFDAINEVDIAFELGDGYYDVTDSLLYGVYGKGGRRELLGYIKWAHLSYTEGEDTEVEVHFDRNGLRLDFDLE